MKLNSAKDLEVYKKAYRLAMDIFEISKRFPPEERFALIGQVFAFCLSESARGMAETALRSSLCQQVNRLRRRE